MNSRPAGITRLRALVAATVLLASAALPCSEAAAAGDGVLVQAETLDGGRVRGRLMALDAEGVTLAGDAGESRVPFATLYRLQVPGAEASPPLQGGSLRVHLIGGERLLGRFAGPAPDGLVVETATLGRVTLRFDAIRSLAALPEDAEPCYEPEARMGPADGDDVAYVRSGDATTGLLLRADLEGLVLEDARSREHPVPWDELAVLHLENEAPSKDEGVRFEVETSSGDRLLSAGPPALEGLDTLVLSLLSDADVVVRVPLARTRSLRAYGGASYVFASDLPFESVFETPYATAEDDPAKAFLASWYGTRTDRRPSGCPLTLQGVTYEHGFAVHARSRVTLDLGGRYRLFRALVGVDDVALAHPGGGLIDARVLGDGKVLWEARSLRAGEAPRMVGPLDVSGVRALVLEVDFGEDGLHVRDYATWADPVLVGK